MDHPIPADWVGLAAEVAQEILGERRGMDRAAAAGCQAKMRLGPTDKAELDSLWICHHGNFPFFKSVLI
jgi:hypothetical protein